MESRSVSVATLTDYYKRALAFQQWASRLCVTPFSLPVVREGREFLRGSGKHRYDGPRPLLHVAPEDLDELLVRYFDEWFMKQRPAAQGEKLVAALAFFFPKLNKLGSAPLSHAVRALRGWRRAVPPQSRLPLPMIGLLALVDEILETDWEMALALILAFHCFLRPGEVGALTLAQVVAAPGPSGAARMKVGLVLAPLELAKPSKTGLWEEAVLIDRCDPIIRPLLALKSHAIAHNTKLWSFCLGALSARMRQATERVGLNEFNISAYSLRHGGASHDLRCQLRPLQEVKRRVRWASDSSLKRFSKETRLIEVMQRVPPETVGRATRLQSVLAETLLNRIPAHLLAFLK